MKSSKCCTQWWTEMSVQASYIYIHQCVWGTYSNFQPNLWADMVKLYEEDKQTPIRLTKLTYSSVHPKPLQRQSAHLVWQVFHEKTYAALEAFWPNLHFSRGTMIFINIRCKWYKMMNVKSKFSSIALKDDSHLPWTENCSNFEALQKTCDIISMCKWKGGRGRRKNLTKFTADALLITTTNNIAASKYLIANHNFEYILSAVFSQNPLEKFFEQGRQHNSGNFSIDIVDVIAV